MRRILGVDEEERRRRGAEEEEVHMRKRLRGGEQEVRGR